MPQEHHRLAGGQPMVVIQGAPVMPPKPVTKPDRVAAAKVEAARVAQRETMRDVAGDIMRALQPLVAQGKVRLLETSRGVTIEINDSILFSLGQANLQPASNQCPAGSGGGAGGFGFSDHHRRAIPDNVPIATPQFPLHWSCRPCGQPPCCACSTMRRWCRAADGDRLRRHSSGRNEYDRGRAGEKPPCEHPDRFGTSGAPNRVSAQPLQ